MLVKFGSVVTEGSGSLGSHTVQNSRGGMQLRTKPVPSGLPSSDQRFIRSLNPQLQAGWRALTDLQRKIWDLYAQDYGIMNAHGDHRPLSGHSLWMKYQFAQLYAGYSFDPDPFAGPWPHAMGVYDYDGNFYHIVTVGTQQWLKENLKCTHYIDGTLIPKKVSNADWSTDTLGAYCDCQGSPSDSVIYGLFYNNLAARNAHGLGITSWSVPSLSDFVTLYTFLGGLAVAGGKLKEIGFIHWWSPNTDATDLYGMTFLPGGMRTESGAYNWFHQSSLHWSTNYISPTQTTWFRCLYTSAAMSQANVNQKRGCPVRLFRNL